MIQLILNQQQEHIDRFRQHSDTGKLETLIHMWDDLLSLSKFDDDAR